MHATTTKIAASIFCCLHNYSSSERLDLHHSAALPLQILHSVPGKRRGLRGPSLPVWVNGRVWAFEGVRWSRAKRFATL